MSRTIAMVKGTIWAPEWKKYQDRLTGIEVHQLTDYRGHSRQLYFTENGLYDEGRRLLFVSDRDNSANLFSIHLETGEMTQLTTYTNNDDLQVCLTPDGQQALLQKEDTISLLDLTSFRERVKYHCPEGFRMGNISCTADGESVLTCIWQQLFAKNDVEHDPETTRKRNDHDTFHEVIDNKDAAIDRQAADQRMLESSSSFSQIIAIHLHTRQSEIVHEGQRMITHVQASPIHPWLLTFYQEDSRELGDPSIWSMDRRSGKISPVRAKSEADEIVGRPYFLSDGETIAYQGVRSSGTSFWGSIRYDQSDQQEQEISFAIHHAYLDGKYQAITDGRENVQTLNLWRTSPDGTYNGPYVLCELRCSFHSPKVHAYPRISQDGRKLFFTSDRTGYANIYMVELPDDISNLHMMHKLITQERK
ncbi:TolB family protein [Paenibacillus dauci]|uniref:TolB family protein n=1 Tax=Paenibacillus dauci TaxID=1567106 RepID=UPI000A544A48|nr:oligogalacturonate lyase family protein [Paenibacillus dauci]